MLMYVVNICVIFQGTSWGRLWAYGACMILFIEEDIPKGTLCVLRHHNITTYWNLAMARATHCARRGKVKAMSLRHQHTANQRRRMHILGAAITQMRFLCKFIEFSNRLFACGAYVFQSIELKLQSIEEPVTIYKWMNFGLIPRRNQFINSSPPSSL